MSGSRITLARWHANVCMQGNGDRCDVFPAIKAKARICRVCDNEVYGHELDPNATVPVCQSCAKARAA